METQRHFPDEMSFEEFKELVAGFGDLAARHGFACAAPLRTLHALLRTGCSAVEAQHWLRHHAADFPADLRDALMARFCDGTVEEPEQESVRGMTEDEVNDRFTEILKQEGIEAAREWLRNNARRR